MLLPAPAIAGAVHANEDSLGRVHRPTAMTLRRPHSLACCLKKQQILLWLSPEYETIAGSLVQWLQAATDTHREPKELHIQKQPAAILPA